MLTREVDRNLAKEFLADIESCFVLSNSAPKTYKTRPILLRPQLIPHYLIKDQTDPGITLSLNARFAGCEPKTPRHCFLLSASGRYTTAKQCCLM